MKKTTLILATILTLTLTGACAEGSKAENKEPEPRYYEIMAVGSSYMPDSYHPNSFATYDNNGKLGTAVIDEISFDESIDSLVGSCLYGNLKSRDFEQSLVIIPCPE